MQKDEFIIEHMKLIARNVNICFARMKLGKKFRLVDDESSEMGNSHRASIKRKIADPSILNKTSTSIPTRGR